MSGNRWVCTDCFSVEEDYVEAAPPIPQAVSRVVETPFVASRKVKPLKRKLGVTSSQMSHFKCQLQNIAGDIPESEYIDKVMQAIREAYTPDMTVVDVRVCIRKINDITPHQKKKACDMAAAIICRVQGQEYRTLHDETVKLIKKAWLYMRSTWPHFTSYSHATYKICELYIRGTTLPPDVKSDMEFIMRRIPTPTISRRVEQDRCWRNMCTTINWTYYPTSMM